MDLIHVQRRTVRVLAAAQVLGGIGVASGVAVGALLAADLGSDSVSGLASASTVIGAALIAVPIARVMNVRGRGPGLLLAYGVGTVGALLTITGAITGLLVVALLGLLLTGGGSAAGLQSRYAATDLAAPDRRGRSLATVVWATTLGSVVGPNVAEPMGNLAVSVGVPRLAGPYMLTVAAFVIAALVIAVFLRPDPLLVARRSRDEDAGLASAGPVRRTSLPVTLRSVVSVPSAGLGLLSVAAGHAVMVGVMSMTPLHLQHGGASLRIIGFVISGHITGMYIASPLVGALADRWGRRQMIFVGGALLFVSVAIAGTSSGHDSTQLGAGLFLLGIGWSCTLIAGSTLLTESVAPEERPTVQGASDLVMGFSGAGAGILSGVVVGFGSYGLLTLIAALLIAPLPLLAIRDARRVVLVEASTT